MRRAADQRRDQQGLIHSTRQRSAPGLLWPRMNRFLTYMLIKRSLASAAARHWTGSGGQRVCSIPVCPLPTMWAEGPSRAAFWVPGAPAAP